MPRQRIVEATMTITDRNRTKTLERYIRIDDNAMSDFLSEITCGDWIRIKGFLPLRIESIVTKPAKDIRGHYSLAVVTFNCIVGDAK